MLYAPLELIYIGSTLILLIWAGSNFGYDIAQFRHCGLPRAQSGWMDRVALSSHLGWIVAALGYLWLFHS